MQRREVFASITGLFGLFAIPSWLSVKKSKREIVLDGKKLESLENFLKIACSPGNYDFDPYLHGMANGLILVDSLIHEKEPKFLDAPEKWLSKQERPIHIEKCSQVDTWKIHEKSNS
jgi:hypothetical protein